MRDPDRALARLVRIPDSVSLIPVLTTMPLYEYECDACHQRFERIQKYSDAPVDVCAKCGKGPVRKLPSSPAIQFKGSGFYINDYARKSSTDAGKTNSDSSSSADSSSSTASDSSAKPAAKADKSAKSDKSSGSSDKT